MVQLISLSSGSSGNASVLLSDQGGLLIDCGLGLKVLRARLAEAAIAPDAIKAVLLTHEHGDHARGIRYACSIFKAKLYTTDLTYQACKRAHPEYLPPDSEILTFCAGDRIALNDFDIRTFSVPHDATDTIGLNIRCQGAVLGFATDLGTVNAVAQRHLHDCDALVLESNYDPDMLRESRRPALLKRRIMSNQGHLSNADALCAVETLVTARTRNLVLAHLSQECNDPDLVRSLFENKFLQMNLPCVRVHTACAHAVIPPIMLVNT